MSSNLTYLPWDSVSNVKALVGTLNQEKALIGAFSVIAKSWRIFVNLRLKLYLSLAPPPAGPRLTLARGPIVPINMMSSWVSDLRPISSRSVKIKVNLYAEQQLLAGG